MQHAWSCGFIYLVYTHRIFTQFDQIPATRMSRHSMSFAHFRRTSIPKSNDDDVHFLYYYYIYIYISIYEYVFARLAAATWAVGGFLFDLCVLWLSDGEKDWIGSIDIYLYYLSYFLCQWAAINRLNKCYSNHYYIREFSYLLIEDRIYKYMCIYLHWPTYVSFQQLPLL